MVAGDFNEWALEWGSKEINAKDRSLLDPFTQLDIILGNEDYVNALRKVDLRQS